MDRFVSVLNSNCPPTEQEALGIRGLLQELAQAQLDELNTGSPRHGRLPAAMQLRQSIVASLRSALSAMRSLPAEILGQIFIVCRDESLDEREYETTNPNSAPMVLTHVCSRWRMVALSTPRLWNNVRLLTGAFVDGRETLVREIFDRSCSAPLSITLANPPEEWNMSFLDPDCRNLPLPDNDIVWNSTRRLRHLSLDVYSGDAGSQLCRRQTVFPQLLSLEILVSETDEPDMHAILDSFGSSPLLRSLTLSLRGVLSDDVVPATFPLAQLTKLDINAPLTTIGARDILVQCTALEIANLHGLLDWDDHGPLPPHDICTLRHLSQLDVAIVLGAGVAELLDTLTVPQLTSLSITSSPWPHQVDQSADALLALHTRSQFSLTHLSLVQQELTLPQFVSILRVPTLEMLVMESCTSITNPLFETLARDAVNPADAPELSHPHLAVFEIHPVADVDGGVIAGAVEYLAAGAGHPDSAFPMLRSLCLSPRDPAFQSTGFTDGVEARLAAVRATGFLVDWHHRHVLQI
ncbi:hypothetical protein DFH06DRAFT_1473774 [Mycena polygramma]|nr:hypothetical protein DFH06DRAFT_1473774 [Mycena polygramma]